MANETELERLVVRLTGDGASFQSMMTTAQKETTQTGNVLNAFTGQVGNITGSITNLATGALAAIGSLKLGGWLAEAKEAYNEQITSERQLNAMLVANGRAVTSTFERYKTFSEELQTATGFADEHALSLLKQAEAFGITGEAAERAVKNYVAVTAAGIPMRGGLRALVALEQGHSEMLMRTFPALKDITNETQRAAEAQKILARIYGIAQQEGQRTAVQLKVAWSEMLEEFGKSVFEIMQPVLEVKLAMVNWLRSLSPEIKQAIVFIAMAGTGLLALVAIIKTGFFIFGLIGSTIGLLLLPMAALAAGASVWVSSVGGVAKAWEIVKGKALEFWDWIRPTFNALTGLLDAFKDNVLQMGKDMAKWMDPMVSVGGSKLKEFFTWVKDGLTEVLLFSEFVTRNFGAAWELYATSAAYHAVLFANEFMHLFQETIPNSLARFFVWFKDAWQSSTDWISDVLAAVFSGEAVDWQRINRMFTGSMNAADARRAREFRDTPREEGEVERELRREFERLSATLGEDYAAFRARRMAEINAPQSTTTPRGGTEGGGGREVQKVEAALFGSAESAFRVQSQFLRFGLPERTQAQNIAAIADRAAMTNQILNQINRGINQIAENPPVQVQGANV